MNVETLEKAKSVIFKNYTSADCGIFSSRNTVGDEMETIFKEDGIQIDICYNWAYFEVFCDNDEDFEEIEEYYDSLEYIKNLDSMV